VHVRKLLLPIAILLAPASLATVAAMAQPAGTAPILSTDRGCFLVGQSVAVTGTGFAPARMYELVLDGVDLGISTTTGTGGFTDTIRPGGLGANKAQYVETLSATDGTNTSKTRFTVTRTTGARILPGRGTTATSFRAPFQVWGFALVNGLPPVVPPANTQLPVYVHYVGPHKRVRKTVALGHTAGQCGYLQTAARRVFPFAPGAGTWTLQVDTHIHYVKHPVGPVFRISVRVA